MKTLFQIFGYAAIASTLFVGGCQKSAPPPGGGSGNRPPPELDVSPAVTREITDYREFTGRTASTSIVDVRARVSGYLLQSPQAENRHNSVSENQAGPNKQPTNDFQVTVNEGDSVTAGTPIFEVDPEPYKLALEQAQGSLESTKSSLKRLELDLDRAKELIGSNSISKADYDLAVANQAEAIGQLANVQAGVDRAKLDLSYTRVTAPIDGLLGRALVTSGNLISADMTMLSTIISQNPIYVYFDVDERSLLDYRRRIRGGSVKSARNVKIPISLKLSNETEFSHQGEIDFVDNQTDPDTGNTRVRGTFNNDNGSLSPGLFARIKAPFTSQYAATMIPTKALAMDQQGQYVLIVDEKQIAHRRSVSVGTNQDGQTVVIDGVQPGELVITSGLQQAREGVKVVPRQADEPPPNETAATATKDGKSEAAQ